MPNTVLVLCKVPKLNGDFHYLMWAGSSTAAIENYFNGKSFRSFTDLQYQRLNDSTIKIGVPQEQVADCNYCYIKNASGITMYYAITSVDYVSPTTTQLTMMLNPFYTYWPYLTVQPFFIEREITNTDNLFEHNLDEGLSIGEKNYISKTNSKMFNPNYTYCIAAKLHPSGLEVIPGVRQFGHNVLSYACVAYDYPNTSAGRASLHDLVRDEPMENIYAMGMMPGIAGPSGTPAAGYAAFDSCGSDSASVTLNGRGANDSLNGYVPKNKKLFSSPYCYVKFGNYSGNSKILKPEMFTNGATQNVTFSFRGNLLPSPSVMGYPTNYEGLANNMYYGVEVSNYPTIPLGSDLLRAEILRNKGKTVANIVSPVAGTIAAGITMAATTSTAVGAVALANVALNSGTKMYDEANRYQMQMPKVDGLQAQMDLFGYDISQYTIDAEHARAIDDYFTMYGYKVNKVKTPDMFAPNHRLGFGYCKGDFQCTGSIPNSAKEAITQLFRDGLTIWFTEAAGYGVGNPCAS